MFTITPKPILLVLVCLTFAIASCGAEPPPEPTNPPPPSPTAIPPTETVEPTRTPIPRGSVKLCLNIEEGTVVTVATLHHTDFDVMKFAFDEGCATLRVAPNLEYAISIHDGEEIGTGWTYLCQTSVKVEPGQSYEFEVSVSSCVWSE